MSVDGSNRSDIESGAKMLEQLEKTFSQVDAGSFSTLANFIRWEDIKEYFCNIEMILKKKLDDLAHKEKNFKEKQHETQAILAERRAAVSSKEHALLDRLQEIKDAAVSAIVDSREKYKVYSPNLDDMKTNKEEKVSSFASDAINVRGERLADNKSGKSAEKMDGKGHLQSFLKKLCEQMDVKGLLKFLSENRKSLVTLREELPLALKNATEPARLVLDALQGFYPTDQPTSQANEKDMPLQTLRRSCLLLLESAAPLLATTDPSSDHPVIISSEIRQQAKAIADQWRPILACLDVDASNGNSLEAQAFLQLLATFNIASDFDEDELCNIVLPLCRRRQTPELCRSLGLTHKMPDVVETLVNSGKEIYAVHLAHAFELTDRFPPVPLIKAYVVGLEKNEQETNGGIGDSSKQRLSISEEMNALRAAIRCIEEYNLQGELPTEPLYRKLAQLDKVRANKKRVYEVSYAQSKKPRPTNAGYPPRRAATAQYLQASPFESRGSFYGVSERYPYSTTAGVPGYEAPLSRAYDIGGHAPQTLQSKSQRFYPYSVERVPSASSSSASGTYNAPQYSSYQDGTAHAVTYPNPALPGASAHPSGSYLSPALQPSPFSQGIYSASGYHSYDGYGSGVASSIGGSSSSFSGGYQSHQPYM